MTIPASYFVGATPGVLSAGGNSLIMNGLFLTENLAMPTFSVLNFASPAAVGAFFGLSSAEYAASLIYFAGFTNSTIKPGSMLFAPFNLAARAGFLQSGSLASLSLTALQALTGTLTITFAGTPETSSTINLSSATSYTNAASIIQAGFTSPVFSVTWSSTASAFIFTSTASGATETVAYATGTLAASLNLTQANGALLSQGAAIDTPASAMNNVIAISQNWASMVPLFEPNLAAKQAFAVWFGAQNNQYLGLLWDSDVNASVQGNTECFGYLASPSQGNYNGVAAFSGDPALAVTEGTTLAALAMNEAIFAAGAIASINFNAANGRTSLAFLQSSQIQPTCANLQIAENLTANGYNYYGSVASANQGFVFLYNGQMFGPFLSITRYVNQIFLNSQMELALLTYALAAGSMGYTPAEYDLIRNVLLTPITAGINFGAIRTNVTLSGAQISELNQAAGVNAASMVQTQGYYLQVADPGAAARATGATPIINFWYTDGGDILKIQIASIDVL